MSHPNHPANRGARSLCLDQWEGEGDVSTGGGKCEGGVYCDLGREYPQCEEKRSV